MWRAIYKYGLAWCLCCMASVLWGQNTDRDYLRSGNRLYRDSAYAKAEVDYRKAIELNGRSPQAYFNLGNALLRQQKPKEAMQAYEQAVKVETNKGRLASIYHNMGVILQSQKQFGPAIECYKNALRRNPSDDETRYNLVLCQHQLRNKQATYTGKHKCVEQASGRTLDPITTKQENQSEQKTSCRHLPLIEAVQRRTNGYQQEVQRRLGGSSDAYQGKGVVRFHQQIADEPTECKARQQLQHGNTRQDAGNRPAAYGDKDSDRQRKTSCRYQALQVLVSHHDYRPSLPYKSNPISRRKYFPSKSSTSATR